MTKPIDPYSRLYWRLIDDEKFATIYLDDAAFALWARLLMTADMAFPASASLPFGTKPRSLAKLVGVGLVDTLPAGRYRVHGLAAERDRRGAGREPDGNPNGTGTGRSGSLRREEKSKEENGGVLSDEQRRANLDRLKAMMDASGLLPKETTVLDSSEHQGSGTTE
jgi:hypothetical protein